MFDSDQVADHATSIELLPGLEHFFGRLYHLFRQIHRWGFHLHHASPRHINRQCSHMVQVRMRHEKRWNPDEVPGASPQIEPQLQLGNPPVTLNGCPRIPFDRQATMLISKYGKVFEHGKLRPQ